MASSCRCGATAAGRRRAFSGSCRGTERGRAVCRGWWIILGCASTRQAGRRDVQRAVSMPTEGPPSVDARGDARAVQGVTAAQGDVASRVEVLNTKL